MFFKKDEELEYLRSRLSEAKANMVSFYEVLLKSEKLIKGIEKRVSATSKVSLRPLIAKQKRIYKDFRKARDDHLRILQELADRDRTTIASLQEATSKLHGEINLKEKTLAAQLAGIEKASNRIVKLAETMDYRGALDESKAEVVQAKEDANKSYLRSVGLMGQNQGLLKDIEVLNTKISQLEAKLLRIKGNELEIFNISRYNLTGLTPIQQDAFRRILQQGSDYLTYSDLRRVSKVSKDTLSILMKKLKAKGYLKHEGAFYINVAPPQSKSGKGGSEGAGSPGGNDDTSPNE